MKVVIFLFFLFCGLYAQISSESIKVYLVGDTGNLLARCNGCGPGSYPDSAGVHAARGAPWATWSAFSIGNKVAFQSDSGKYLARCNGCWAGGANPDSAFVHESNPNNPWAQWTPVLHDDGTYSFLSDNGKYLARCNGCVPRGATPDFGFVHETNSNNPWAKWRVELVK